MNTKKTCTHNTIKSSTNQSLFSINLFALITEARLNLLGDVLTSQTQLLDSSLKTLLFLVQNLRLLRPENTSSQTVRQLKNILHLSLIHI